MPSLQESITTLMTQTAALAATVAELLTRARGQVEGGLLATSGVLPTAAVAVGSVISPAVVNGTDRWGLGAEGGRWGITVSAAVLDLPDAPPDPEVFGLLARAYTQDGNSVYQPAGPAVVMPHALVDGTTGLLQARLKIGSSSGLVVRMSIDLATAAFQVDLRGLNVAIPADSIVRIYAAIV